jgi:dimethylhistidine N-methyltransferase
MLDAAFTDQAIAAIALEGLTARPKTLPPKLFYDADGVRLFEAITRLPEYYVTRTERALLERFGGEIAALAAPGSALVEFGASDEAKAALLLDRAQDRFTTYVPIDVAQDALRALAARLRKTHPSLEVEPVCGDFLAPLVLPALGARTPGFGFFPGSTIGNLDPTMAISFLANVRRALGAGAWLIVGVDLRKDISRLLNAYDDAAGVTAAFNRNLLTRLNREAAADFIVEDFAHRARWNEAESRIEMHLESLRAHIVHIAGHVINFAAGETIHTENSYKHSVAGFQALAGQAGWSAERLWMDDEKLFSIHALKAD